jgi:hypothetical protein
MGCIFSFVFYDIKKSSYELLLTVSQRMPIEAHPGVMKALHIAPETPLESWRLILVPWRLNQEPWRLNLEPPGTTRALEVQPEALVAHLEA